MVPRARRRAPDRLRGYKKGLANVGLAVNRSLVVASDYTEAGGFAATVRNAMNTSAAIRFMRAL